MTTHSSRTLFLIVFLAVVASAAAQTGRFRSGIFLHHSTGGCIWGPNGSPTSVPAEIAKYNDTHGLNGADSVSLAESGWPVEPWNNEWERWHRIFDNEDTVDADIRPVLSGNSIVVIKSCFPSSELVSAGTAADTSDPTMKSVSNYKWHWRNFIRVMAKHPANFFVVWTNAPLVAGATNDNQAKLSDAFCRWAKDTLAKGLDPVYGPFPSNVFVFDFYHKLAGFDGKLPGSCASSSTDSHPNADATALVAPLFVNEIFDAAIAYENKIIGVGGHTVPPDEFELLQNYPNPFNPATVIGFVVRSSGLVSLKVYDVLGREVATLVNESMKPGSYRTTFDGSRLASGVYFYKMTVVPPSGRKTGYGAVRKLVLVR